MKKELVTSILLIGLFGCVNPSPSGTGKLPPVSEACAVLRDYRGEYNFGGVGIVGQTTDGELALWTIYKSTNAAQLLTNLYPQSQAPGKAYALAALYHVDKAAFRKLTNDFCQEAGNIIVASGCTIFDETRPDLVFEMQRRRSTMAFHPSEPPRSTSMEFSHRNLDVYAEQRKQDEARTRQKATAFAVYDANPKLAAFKSLFEIEDPSENGGSTTGVYFFGTHEWSARFVPRDKLAFPAMVDAIFPITNKVVQVGLEPAELMDELKDLADIPFINELDRKIGVKELWLRAAGDRLHWNTEEAEHYEKTLDSKEPLRNWVCFSVELEGKGKPVIEFYHPKGTDNFVVSYSLFSNPEWRLQYAKLTGHKPRLLDSTGDWEYPDSKFVPVVDRSGKLRLLPAQ